VTTDALILLLHERVLPGGQLVNQVEDMGYKVQVISEPTELLPASLGGKPLMVMADLHGDLGPEVKRAIESLRAGEKTAHIPVIAYGVPGDPESLKSVQMPGETLVVTDAGVLAHLEQLMEQALHVE